MTFYKKFNQNDVQTLMDFVHPAKVQFEYMLENHSNLTEQKRNEAISKIENAKSKVKEYIVNRKFKPHYAVDMSRKQFDQKFKSALLKAVDYFFLIDENNIKESIKAISKLYANAKTHAISTFPSPEIYKIMLQYGIDDRNWLNYSNYIDNGEDIMKQMENYFTHKETEENQRCA